MADYRRRQVWQDAIGHQLLAGPIGTPSLLSASIQPRGRTVAAPTVEGRAGLYRPVSILQCRLAAEANRIITDTRAQLPEHLGEPKEICCLQTTSPRRRRSRSCNSSRRPSTPVMRWPTLTSKTASAHLRQFDRWVQIGEGQIIRKSLFHSRTDGLVSLTSQRCTAARPGRTC